MEECKKCGRDHKLPNEGPLNVCEREAYLSQGGAIGKAGNEKIRGFGLGQNRFQLNEKL